VTPDVKIVHIFQAFCHRARQSRKIEMAMEGNGHVAVVIDASLPVLLLCFCFCCALAVPIPIAAGWKAKHEAQTKIASVSMLRNVPCRTEENTSSNLSYRFRGQPWPGTAMDE